VSNKEGTFSKEGGHESYDFFYLFIFIYFFFPSFGPKYFSAVGGRTVRIHTFRTTVWIWHKNQGILGMNFEADLCFMFVVFGPYGTVRTTNRGHKK
jgi:hypothetical protein